ncbi:hypothetical protein LS482_20065 [Sinomicrobium kalidii]|uniref:hypothetical protein n=1 Tax=Sinomicrobium kalidii TaxID=2900738 RepID=UPI001E607AA6|nr:hypothetical protein [Sinomicrobium kalidii]UGU15961.1 hypothetical protein LS482_20065 [Sinomicrobium kalidii]
MNRFQDKNIGIYHFDNKIIVECPKCRKRAIVTKDEPNKWLSQRTLKCMNCFYTQKGRKIYYQIELKRNCVECGNEINITIPNVNEQKETIIVKCKNCGDTQIHKPRNIEQVWRFLNIGKPTEMYFGLPLWLTDNFKGHNFWALNYEHLTYLKEYISASLRERNGRTGWTIVEKLPDWIKSAKNRDKLLKVIEKLERK